MLEEMSGQCEGERRGVYERHKSSQRGHFEVEKEVVGVQNEVVGVQSDAAEVEREVVQAERKIEEEEIETVEMEVEVEVEYEGRPERRERTRALLNFLALSAGSWSAKKKRVLSSERNFSKVLGNSECSSRAGRAGASSGALVELELDRNLDVHGFA